MHRGEEGRERSGLRGIRRERLAPALWLAHSLRPAPCASSLGCAGTRARSGAGRAGSTGGRRALWAAPGPGHGQKELGAQGAPRDRAAGALSQTKAQELRLLSRAGPRAPRLQDPAAGGSGPPSPPWAGSALPALPGPLFLGRGNLPRRPKRLRGGRDREVCLAPAGRGARERRKFPSRVRGPGERASRACSSAPGQAGRRKHGQRPERARTAGLGGQSP